MGVVMPEPLIGREIVIEAARRFDCTARELRSPCQSSSLVEARHAAVWALRHKFTSPPMSKATIARIVGLKPGSIKAAIRRAEQRRREDPTFRLETDRLLKLARGEPLDD